MDKADACDIDDFIIAFDRTTNLEKDTIYRGLDLNDKDLLLSNYTDDELLQYLADNSNELESGTIDYNIARNFSDDFSGKRGKYAVVIEMGAELYYDISQKTTEREVILFQPVYKKIVYKKAS